MSIVDSHHMFPHGPGVLVTLEGEFDLALHDELEQRLQRALDRDDVRVDAAGVTFIDGGSLRLIARARRVVVARGGRFTVVRWSPTFELVSGLAGFPELCRGDVADRAQSSVEPGTGSPRPGEDP